MNLSKLFLVPFALQGIAMLFDEFYFHHLRRLPKWERLGHPLDTLTVIACFLVLLLTTPTFVSISAYVSLSVLSCLFVTKDEAVHLKKCTAGETWLHSVLFILHPLILISAGLIWCSQTFVELSFLTDLHFVLAGQTYLTIGFLVYQIGYWNFYAKNER